MQTAETCNVSLETILAAPHAPRAEPLGAHVERMTSQQIFAHFAEAVLHAALLRMGATVLVPYFSSAPLADEALPSARVEFDDMAAVLRNVDGLLAMVRSMVVQCAPPGTQLRAVVDRPRVVWRLPANVPRSSTSCVLMGYCGLARPVGGATGSSPADAPSARLPPVLTAADVMDEALRELAAKVTARCARPRGPRGPCGARVTGGHGGGADGGEDGTCW